MTRRSCCRQWCCARRADGIGNCVSVLEPRVARADCRTCCLSWWRDFTPACGMFCVGGSQGAGADITCAAISWLYASSCWRWRNRASGGYVVGVITGSRQPGRSPRSSPARSAPTTLHPYSGQRAATRAAACARVSGGGAHGAATRHRGGGRGPAPTAPCVGQPLDCLFDRDWSAVSPSPDECARAGLDPHHPVRTAWPGPSRRAG